MVTVSPGAHGSKGFGAAETSTWTPDNPPTLTDVRPLTVNEASDCIQSAAALAVGAPGALASHVPVSCPSTDDSAMTSEWSSMIRPSGASRRDSDVKAGLSRPGDVGGCWASAQPAGSVYENVPLRPFANGKKLERCGP